MSYLVRKLNGAEARLAATDSPPMGPGVPEEVALDIESLEVWGSSVTDPGDDWVEFRAFGGEKPLGVWRVAGY